MASNRGKQWEAKVMEDFAKLPGASIDRIYDVTGGKLGVRNV